MGSPGGSDPPDKADHQVPAALGAALLAMDEDPVAVLDAAGRYVAVNPGWEAFTGLRAAEVVGRTLDEVGLGGGAAAASVRGVLAGEPAPGRFMRTGGRWVHLRYLAWRDGAGAARGVLVVGRDVTSMIEADLLPDLVLRLDPGLRVGFMNRAAAAALGVEPSAVLGRTPGQAGLRAAPALEAAARRALVAGDEVRREVALAPDGPAAVDLRVVPERGPTGAVTGLVLVGRDTSRQAATAAELRASRQAYRTLLDAAPDGIVRYDRGLRHVDVNAAFCALAGVPAEALIGRRPDQVPVEAQVADEAVARVGQVLADGAVQRFEVERDGAVMDVILAPERGAAGEVAYVVGVVRDVTEQRAAERAARADEVRAREAAERALARSEMRFRAAAEASLDAVAVLGAVRDGTGRVIDFRVEEANARAAHMAGTSPAGLRGQVLSRLLGPRAGLVREAAEVMDRGRPAEGEASFAAVPGVRADWVRYQLVPLPSGVALTLRDISAQREADLRLRRSAEAIERLAAEQGALRRAATAAAGGAPPEALFDLVAREVAELFGVQAAAVARFEPDADLMEVAGAFNMPWARGARLPLPPGSAAMAARAGGQVRRQDDYAERDDELARALVAAGLTSSVGMPVVVGGRVWGVLSAFAARPAALPPRAEDRLARFGELIGLALANAEADAGRRMLMAELVQAEERERRRIAEGIHDDAVQVVSAAALRLATLAETAGGATAAALAAVRADLRAVGERLRTLMVDLEPPPSGQAGLVSALRAHVAELAARAGLGWRLHGELEREPDPGVRSIVWRVALEALTNARRHAGARTLVVGIGARDGGIELTVQDDGRGFAPPPGGRTPGHRGLELMRERVRLAHGTLDVTSRPGAGTLVRAWVPEA